MDLVINNECAFLSVHDVHKSIIIELRQQIPMN